MKMIRFRSVGRQYIPTLTPSINVPVATRERKLEHVSTSINRIADPVAQCFFFCLFDHRFLEIERNTIETVANVVISNLVISRGMKNNLRK